MYRQTSEPEKDWPDFSIDGWLDQLYAEKESRLSAERVYRGEISLEAWQREMNDTMKKLLGHLPETGNTPSFDIAEKVDCGTYDRIRVHVSYMKGLTGPMYLLIPHDLPSDAAAVVCPSGHGIGCRAVIGLNVDGTLRTVPDPEDYHEDYGLSLVKRGLVVIAPEILGFGELRLKEDIGRQEKDTSCFKVSHFLSMLGLSTGGIRGFQTSAAVDVLLKAVPQVNPGRVGLMGISGGGTAATLAAAIDGRFAAIVISGYPNTFRKSLMGEYPHCACNFLPGWASEMELYDLYSSFCPRPLFFESGTLDNMFPEDGVRECFEKTQKMYEYQGVKDRLEMDIFEGRHRVCGRKSFDWLADHLRGIE